MKKTFAVVFTAALVGLPLFSVARSSFEAPYLSCVAQYPVVSLGNAGRFHVVSNTNGPFMWVANSEHYGVYDAGTDFVTPLTALGKQQVTVVWGSKRASCFVDVVAAPGYGEPYAGGRDGHQYGEYYYGDDLNVTLTATAYPRLPNAGFEPQTLAALVFAFVFLLGAAIAFYPHARKAFAIVAR